MLVVPESVEMEKIPGQLVLLEKCQIPCVSLKLGKKMLLHICLEWYYTYLNNRWNINKNFYQKNSKASTSCKPLLLLSATFIECARELPRFRLCTFLIPTRLFLKDAILKLSGLRFRLIYKHMYKSWFIINFWKKTIALEIKGFYMYIIHARKLFWLYLYWCSL